MPEPLQQSDSGSCRAPSFRASIRGAATTEQPKGAFNRQVENYRVLIGPSTQLIEWLETVLDYSKTPLHQRGVSKLVVDSGNYEVLKNHHAGDRSESSSLLEKLMDEGVEIIEYQEVFQYIKTKYPEINQLLSSVREIDFKDYDSTEDKEIDYSIFLSKILSYILPSYAFSQNIDKELKSVTVIPINLLSSLFLPGNASTENHVKILMKCVIKWHENGESRVYVLDTSSTDFLIKKTYASVLNAENMDVFTNYGILSGTSPFIDTDQYLQINSADFAHRLAKDFSSLASIYLTKPLFAITNEYTTGIKRNDRTTTLESVKNLTDFVADKKHEDDLFCVLVDINYINVEDAKKSMCTKSSHHFLAGLSHQISENMFNKFFISELKKTAKRLNVTCISKTTNEAYLQWSPEQHKSNYYFRVLHPQLICHSQKKEALQDLLNVILANAIDRINAKYIFPDTRMANTAVYLELDQEFTQCSLFVNKTQVNRLLKNGWPELNTVHQEIMASYPSGEKHCGPYDNNPSGNNPPPPKTVLWPTSAQPSQPEYFQAPWMARLPILAWNTGFEIRYPEG